MKKFLVLSVLCSLIACSSSSATKEDKPEEQQPKNVYRNPVIDYSLPDPSVIEEMMDTTICMPPRTYAICRFTVPRTWWIGSM